MPKKIAMWESLYCESTASRSNGLQNRMFAKLKPGTLLTGLNIQTLNFMKQKQMQESKKSQL